MAKFDRIIGTFRWLWTTELETFFFTQEEQRQPPDRGQAGDGLPGLRRRLPRVPSAEAGAQLLRGRQHPSLERLRGGGREARAPVVQLHHRPQPPPPRRQLGHQHPRLHKSQLAVSGGVQEGVRQMLECL